MTPRATFSPLMTALKSLRETLGFSSREVLSATGWPPGKLAQFESTNDVDDEAAVVLSDLYGVDIEDALGAEAADTHTPPVATLLKGAAASLSATARFTIAESVTVARSIRRLQSLLGVDSGWREVESFLYEPDYSHPQFGMPEKLAKRLRMRLGLGTGPMASLSGQVIEPLGVVLLMVDLPDDIDAFCLSGRETGAVIAVNRASRHARNAFGRRMTWAHELCHVLFDRPKLAGMKRFCTVSYEVGAPRAVRDPEDEIERRARAFAVWLLAPRLAMHAVCDRARRDPPERRVRAVMECFGIGYWAARSHLQNVNRMGLADVISDVDPSAPEEWDRRDPEPRLHEAALAAGVSSMRAGTLLELALAACHQDLVSEEHVRGLMRLDLQTWGGLRGELGFASTATWRTSSAIVHQ